MADEGFRRKLAAILSADVVGYSLLMDDDEAETIRTFKNYCSVITTLIGHNRGRVVDITGDNLLAEFKSAVDAVNCGTEIQQELVRRNMELPDNRKMLFRIGINVGDVVEEFNKMGFPQDKVIITVAGGIPMSVYEPLVTELAVVRALPNPPSQIGKGIAALAFNPYVTDDQKADIFELFDCLGDHVVVREDLVNAVMALSSPAITYMLFQSLVDAGIRAGIDHKTAARIVSQTIVGSMEVWQQRDVPPHELLTEASTPGGISIESLFSLEKYAFKAALMEAIESAIKRAEDLSRSG